MNILEEANKIINERSEEKERQYGPIGEGLERAAAIASGILGKNLTAHDVFAVLIGLKFSRHSYNYKEDNFLDAAAYLGAWNNYIQDKGDNR
jgi:hypothetical protein